MNELEKYGRGLWTAEAEAFCRRALSRKAYGHIKSSDIARAMSQVAMKRDGYTHFQTGFDAFAFCHKMGFLHAEPPDGRDERMITYVFASPVHRRYTTIVP